MFFYLANDLRTEDFTGEEVIYYSWSSAGPDAQLEPYPSISPPQKLTTWRPGNFKEFSVPLPPRARDGQSYRLVLTTRQHTRAHILNLAARDVGERPLPVMSMPILLTAQARPGYAEKQQAIERVYRVPLGSGKDGFLRVREQTSFDLDKKVWDSGIGLSSWLVETAQQVSPDGASPHLHHIERLKDALFSSDKRRIIELGSGTGIVSLTLGALRSTRTTDQEGCILTTDLESALPLLAHNVSTNDSLFIQSTRPKPLALDWDDESFSEDICAAGGFDAIIMADVTYNTASFPAFVRTLASLVRLSPPDRLPTIVLGYKERDPEERTLWEMVRGIGVTLERIGEREGAGREPVEIWVGKCDRAG
ncbi:putative methyltransferase-domain-containing protein [Daedaleopsis nitida]|nr:putative methyltransferase-domain-containing protein [Daedaleopsis nitida]